MGKFIDQYELRAARDDRVQVHFLEGLILVPKAPSRYDLDAVEQCLRLRPAMSLDDAGDDINSSFQLCVSIFQHGVGLADPRGCADKNLKAPGRAVFPPSGLKQSLR